MDNDNINLELPNDIQIDDDDVEEELITADKVLENIENAWINEKFSPDILPQQTVMLELMLGQLEHMEENMKLLDKNDFRSITHRMEIERIRYIIVSYLRCRLKKIEKYTAYILNEENNRNDIQKRLSNEETKYAKEYLKHIEDFYQRTVLQYIPNIQRSSDLEQRIIRPNLMSHVFIKANETVSSVVVGTDDEEVDLIKGSQHIIPYRLISDLILNGKAQLI